MSAAFVRRSRPGSSRSLVQNKLGQGLDLRKSRANSWLFRDLVRPIGIYPQSCRATCTVQGVTIELGAYQTHVFIDFKEMADDAGGRLARLDAYLQGSGRDSLEKAGREMSLQPLHRALARTMSADLLNRQLDVFHGRPGSKKEGALWQELEEKIFNLLSLAPENASDAAGSQKAAEVLLEDLLALRTLFRPERGRPKKGDGRDCRQPKNICKNSSGKKPELERLFLLWLYARRLTESGSEERPDNRTLFAEWMLDSVLAESLRGWGFSESRVEPALRMIRIACGLGKMIRACSTALAASGGERGRSHRDANKNNDPG